MQESQNHRRALSTLSTRSITILELTLRRFRLHLLYISVVFALLTLLAVLVDRRPDFLLPRPRAVSAAALSESPSELDTATLDMPSPASLSAFLARAKTEFLGELKAGTSLARWVVCVGNEAGDLDSIASAVGYAFFASQLDSQRAFVPLVHTARGDLYLRPENVDVLKSSQITNDDLVCLNDIDPLRPAALGASFALVDHNKLLPEFGPANVVAIIDHHADEGFHLDANPRKITLAGSCSSLVTQHFAPLLPSPSSLIPATLADLLISAVLIDTSLKPVPDGKATTDDVAAAAFLVPLSTFVTLSGTWVKTKAGELAAVKGSVGHLSGRDLLRRDYKEYQVGPWRYGIATIPLPLSTWLAKSDVAGTGWALVQADVEAYAKEHDLQMVIALTSYNTVDSSKKSGKGKHERELLVYITDPKLAPLFDEIPKDSVLELGTWRGGDVNLDRKAWRVWQQENAKATRKQVAPVVKTILESLDGSEKN
ncbi:hypothetical protein RQP46_005485 [Phenoliferia psychrophenolica]